MKAWLQDHGSDKYPKCFRYHNAPSAACSSEAFFAGLGSLKHSNIVLVSFIHDNGNFAGETVIN